MISARIVADSIGPANVRLTTWEWTYPRSIHAEIMTYCMFARNAASSRAIPASKMRERIRRDPAVPVYWGANQKGMQAAGELTGWRLWAAKRAWIAGCHLMLALSWFLGKLGLHKQNTNRVTEPWMYITTIVTADQFALANMWHQRDHEAAQPEFRRLARLAWAEYNLSTPRVLGPGEWHLPFIKFDDEVEAIQMEKDESHGQPFKMTPDEILRAVSVGRVARSSYLNHNGVRDLVDDVALFNKLKDAKPGHWSPFEHVAQALTIPATQGKYHGWTPYRKTFANENLTELPEWKPEDYREEIRHQLGCDYV